MSSMNDLLSHVRSKTCSATVLERINFQSWYTLFSENVSVIDELTESIDSGDASNPHQITFSYNAPSGELVVCGVTIGDIVQAIQSGQDSVSVCVVADNTGGHLVGRVILVPINVIASSLKDGTDLAYIFNALISAIDAYGANTDISILQTFLGKINGMNLSDSITGVKNLMIDVVNMVGGDINQLWSVIVNMFISPDGADDANELVSTNLTTYTGVSPLTMFLNRINVNIDFSSLPAAITSAVTAIAITSVKLAFGGFALAVSEAVKGWMKLGNWFTETFYSQNLVISNNTPDIINIEFGGRKYVKSFSTSRDIYPELCDLLSLHTDEWIIFPTLGSTVYVKYDSTSAKLILAYQPHLYNNVVSQSYLKTASGDGNDWDDLLNISVSLPVEFPYVFGSGYEEQDLEFNIGKMRNYGVAKALYNTQKIIPLGMLLIGGEGLAGRYYQDPEWALADKAVTSVFVENTDPSVFTNERMYDDLVGAIPDDFAAFILRQLNNGVVRVSAGNSIPLWFISSNLPTGMYSLPSDQMEYQQWSDGLTSVAKSVALITAVTISAAAILTFRKNVISRAVLAQGTLQRLSMSGTATPAQLTKAYTSANFYSILTGVSTGTLYNGFSLAPDTVTKSDVDIIKRLISGN